MIDPASSAPVHLEGVTLWSRLRTYFLTGLVVAGPFALTMALVWWFITTVDGWVKPFVPAEFWVYTRLPFDIPGLGLVVAVFVLTLLGFLAANFLGKSLLDWSDDLLQRTPVVKGLYKAFKQVFEMVFSSSSSSFKKAGLVEYPAAGSWSVVLISSEPAPQLMQHMGEGPFVGVFLPCAPNPTTGFFFYVPQSKVKILDISVDEAFKLVVSAGLIQPGQNESLSSSGQ